MTAARKYELIKDVLEAEGNVLSVKGLCRQAGVSRSGYYRWLNAESSRNNREMGDRADFELILKAYRFRGKNKGFREIHMTLLHFDPPVRMNTKKIRRLMKKYGLCCPIRKANPYRRMANAMKTNAYADNVLNRQFELAGPRKTLLTDITYIPYGSSFCYLSVILDSYTRQILAYVLSRTLDVDFVLETVQQLMEKHGTELKTDTLLHSDQGCHYTSHKFIQIVNDAGLRRSMSRRGNCWDNAPQESFFGHMKDEIDLSVCSSFEDIKAVIDDHMDYYNNDRYQWKLMKLSPNQYYEYLTNGKDPLASFR